MRLPLLALHVSPPNPYALTNPPHSSLPAPASGNTIQRWMVTSEFQYRPRGPVIHFLNEQLREAVVEAFFFPVPSMPKRQEPRIDVAFHPISREDVRDVMARESLYLGNNGERVRQGIEGTGHRSSGHTNSWWSPDKEEAS